MAKIPTCAVRRQTLSIEEARDQAKAAAEKAAPELALARSDFEAAAEAAGALEQRTGRLADVRGALPGNSTDRFAVIDRTLADCTEVLSSVRPLLDESVQCAGLVMKQALRFKRLKAIADRAKALIVRQGEDEPLPVDRAYERIKEAVAASVGRLESIQEQLATARRASDAAAAHTLHLEGVVVSVAGVAGELRLQLKEANRLLGSVEADMRRLADAASDLRQHANRHGRAIRLLGDIMSAEAADQPAVDKAYRQFDNFMDRYRELSRTDNYPAEADAYADLMVIQSKMAQMRLAPSLSTRNIVAVAGGFSSGKSSFVNSIIDAERDVLPTQLTPTTAIPTYVLGTSMDHVLDIGLFNRNGGRLLVDTDVLHLITHEFERDYGIGLKEIVDRVVVAIPHAEKWPRIAFVDTPGYTNPEAAGTRHRDEDIALREVLSARSLVWLVDCEKGTLPQADVDYIKRFTDGRKAGATGAVYIVLNKADKISSDHRESILSEVEDTLARNEIPCSGIGLYSAHERQWYGSVGDSLDTFLVEIGRADPDQSLKELASVVLDRYVAYHDNQARRYSVRIGFLRRMGLLIDDEAKSLHSLAEELEDALRTNQADEKRHSDAAKAFRSLRNEIRAALDGFEDALGALARSIS